MIETTKKFVKESLNPQPDRYDMTYRYEHTLRVCMLGRSDIGERSASELIEICDKRLSEIEGSYNRICGTDTAKKYWEEELVKRKAFYEELKRQMEGTWAV